MNTLFSLTSRSVRVFFQTADTIKGTPEVIDSGRRNAIKAGLTGLLVVATATSAVSALAEEVDKGAGQVVETPFGKLSFAQIQKHPERNKILDGMKDADYNAYDSWQSGKVQVVKEANKGKLETQQVAIEDGNRAAERKQVAIKEGIELDKKLLATLASIVRLGKTIEKEYESLVLKYVSVPPPDKNALYIQEEAKKRRVFA